MKKFIPFIVLCIAVGTIGYSFIVVTQVEVDTNKYAYVILLHHENGDIDTLVREFEQYDSSYVKPPAQFLRGYLAAFKKDTTIAYVDCIEFITGDK